MEIPGRRLASFVNFSLPPGSTTVSKIHLAKSGLYYDVREEVVRCYKCLKIIEETIWRSNHCTHDCCPTGRDEPDNGLETAGPCSSAVQRNVATASKKLSKASASGTSSVYREQRPDRQASAISISHIGQHVASCSRSDNNDVQSCEPTEKAGSSRTSQLPANPMFTLANRYRSFNGTSASKFFSTVKAAAEGFYFDKGIRCICCAFCDFTLESENHSALINIFQEHQKRSPNCEGDETKDSIKELEKLAESDGKPPLDVLHYLKKETLNSVRQIVLREEDLEAAVEQRKLTGIPFTGPVDLVRTILQLNGDTLSTTEADNQDTTQIKSSKKKRPRRMYTLSPNVPHTETSNFTDVFESQRKTLFSYDYRPLFLKELLGYWSFNKDISHKEEHITMVATDPTSGQSICLTHQLIEQSTILVHELIEQSTILAHEMIEQSTLLALIFMLEWFSSFAYPTTGLIDANSSSY